VNHSKSHLAKVPSITFHGKRGENQPGWNTSLKAGKRITKGKRGNKEKNSNVGRCAQSPFRKKEPRGKNKKREIKVRGRGL